MELLIVISTFLAIVFLIEGFYYLSRAGQEAESRRARQRLDTFIVDHDDDRPLQLVRPQTLSTVSWLNVLLRPFPWIRALGRLLEQANSRFTVVPFLGVSLAMGFAGVWLGSLLWHQPAMGLLTGVGAGCIPLLLVYYKKQQRMLKFQQQLPEALELVSRSLRAGHTLMVGMKMVGDEFPDPIGAEFDKVVYEVNFGGNMYAALMGLSERIDCQDMHFFVTAVLLQRETGGNLAELLENIARMIRQRFELQGRIRVLAADGKFSAIILVMLPFLIGLFLSVINPEHFPLLFGDPLGKMMVSYAGAMMVFGILSMKKIVKIRV